MAEADLDVVVRRIAKEQGRRVLEAAKKRRDGFLKLADKAKDKPAKDRQKQLAKDTMLHAAAMAKRLQISAENAADSYLRAMKKAVEEAKAAEQKAKENTRQAKPKKASAGKKPAKAA